MNNKLKTFLKKPFLIISIICVAVFLIATIVVACIPHGKTYVYVYEVEGMEFEYKIVLDEKYKATHIYYENDKIQDVGDVPKYEYNYEVYNGKLYLLDNSTTTRFELGEISSKEIILNFSVTGEETNTVLECKINKVLTVVFVTGLVISVLMLIAAISLKYMNFSAEKEAEQNNLNNDDNVFVEDKKANDEGEKYIETEQVVEDKQKVNDNQDVKTEQIVDENAMQTVSEETNK